jgi:DNA polymerase III subunit delta'
MGRLVTLNPIMMHPLVGHLEARRRLADSRKTGRLPQVILVTGPEGVGKQRLGLWLGQVLLCERPEEEPCGACRPCRLVLELGHPDLHWFVPIPRPKAGEADRQVEEASELLAEAVAGRREQPLYRPAEGMASHPLASARLLLRRAALTPVEAKRKVFVVGEADRLVPQESSPEAANALLKFLEEPPADTWVVLTATEPERVLPTMRSRAAPLRLTRLPDSEVRAFARATLRPEPAAEELDLVVRRAEGLIGRLAGSAEAAGKALQDARGLLDALGAGPGGRYERGLRQPPWQARGAFTDLLDALAEELARRARSTADRDTATRLVSALTRVQQARAGAQGNQNPQLLLTCLAGELAEVL